jgi:hypothetical protein
MIRDDTTHGESHMQCCWRAERVEMPAPLTHPVPNRIDVERFTPECDYGHSRLAEDEEIGGEAGGEDGGEGTGGCDNGSTRFGVSATMELVNSQFRLQLRGLGQPRTTKDVRTTHSAPMWFMIAHAPASIDPGLATRSQRKHVMANRDRSPRSRHGWTSIDASSPVCHHVVLKPPQFRRSIQYY